MGRMHYPDNSVFRNILEQQYNPSARYKLYKSVKGSQDWVQRLGLLRKLPIHSGCVNCICWNETGERLLSGSDDQRLVVTNGYNYKIMTDYKTSHRANIFSAKFLPSTNDSGIVSCSGDGMILYTDLTRPEETHQSIFNCHVGTTYEIATIPYDPNIFMSCGEDYTVRCFDLRVKEKCNKTRCTEDVVICCQRAVTALTVNAACPFQLAIGCSDSTVRLYDRRMLSPRDSLEEAARPIESYMAPGMDGRTYRITSLSFSPGGEDILVSYSSEHLYLFGVKDNSTVVLTPEFEAGDSSCGSDGPVAGGESSNSPAAPVRRLRLRGDWSDTGPDARPQNESTTTRAVSQARPTLHGTLMQRMTDVLSRMLNDPATRAALSHGGEDTFPETDEQSSQTESQSQAQGSQETPVQSQVESPVGMVSVDINSYPGSSENQDETSSAEPCPPPPSQAPDPSTPSETVPMDLPLPSFSSTYSSFVKPTTTDSTNAVPSSKNVPQRQPPTQNQNQHQPSTSSAAEAAALAAAAALPAVLNRRVEEKNNISNLKDQLSTMCNGFIEKHGSEPLVSLVYSDKGPTASRISMSVRDASSSGAASGSTNQSNAQRAATASESRATPAPESRATPAPESRATPASERKAAPAPERRVSQPMQVGETSSAPPVENSTSSVATPSSQRPGEPDELLSEDEELAEEEEGEGDEEEEDEDDDEEEEEGEGEEDDFADSDDEMDTEVRTECRAVHPIEKHMDDAIKSARGESSRACDDNSGKRTTLKQKYVGHRNARTMIKEATFWGNDYIVSGSDCGHVFMWHKESAKLTMLLQADQHVVNCVQPHPYLPILATSGIDYDVKLWAPTHEEPHFDLEMATELMKRNAVMLEETKDTITVPASFMIRMLACLNQIRRGNLGGRGRLRRRDPSASSE